MRYISTVSTAARLGFWLFMSGAIVGFVLGRLF
jgi:hypothetical protein